MKAMAEEFELKMSLMEKKYERKLLELNQDKREQHEENRLLEERLAEMEGADNNDLNYDSSESDQDNSATGKVIDDALQKELAALKQEKLEQYEENKLLKKKLARTEAERQSDSMENDGNDINYDTESSHSEEEDNNATTSTPRNKRRDNHVDKYTSPSITNTKPNYESDSNYADSYYDSDTNYADPNYDSDANRQD
jgi:hypothetical protein